MIFGGRQIAVDCGNMVDYGNVIDYSNIVNCSRWYVQSISFFTIIVILTTVRFQVYIIEVYSGRQL